MKNVILVSLLASTLGFGVAAQANDTEPGKQQGQGYSKHKGGKHHSQKGGKRGGNMMKRMAKKLNLTEDQQAQIKTFREAQKETQQALREEQKALRTEMKALDTTSADYDSQVAALADKKANLERKTFIQRSSARQQFSSVLTEEQRTQLKEMKESRKDRGSKGKGKRDGKHGSKHGGKRGGMQSLVEKLELTEAQQEQMKALREAKKENKGSKDKASREAARAEFEAILTPEQLTKFNELKENHKGHGKRGEKSSAE